MTFRVMRDTHLAGCAGLYSTVFNQPPWNGRWTRATAKKHIAEALRTPNFKGVVGLKNDQLLGFAYGVIYQWENERHFYLKEMCVSSERQRSGIGTRLLRNLVRGLIKRNVSQISLGTERNKPARQFYLRLGFAISEDIIIMSKRVSAIDGNGSI
jgi:aminoglycoside 6'-N-acetyltransferase I